MGIKVGVTKVVEVEAKELRIYCKVCDDFTAHLYTAGGELLGGQDDGYVASFMPGDHHGDYLILNIDIETGRVTNWKVPTEKALREWLDKNKDDEDA